eukprot:1459600-Amphidinium_carterae.1
MDQDPCALYTEYAALNIPGEEPNSPFWNYGGSYLTLEATFSLTIPQAEAVLGAFPTNFQTDPHPCQTQLRTGERSQQHLT